MLGADLFTETACGQLLDMAAYEPPSLKALPAHACMTAFARLQALRRPHRRSPAQIEKC